MPTETFQQKFARIQNEPNHREVQVPKIAIDTSFAGIVKRLQEVMDAAHDAGHLQPADHAALTVATTQISAVLARVDEKALVAAVKARYPNMWRRPDR